MAELVAIYDYPMTGGQGRNLDQGWLSAAGFVYDRAFVLYDASIPEGKRNRVSRTQAQLPALAQLVTKQAVDGSSFTIEHGDRKLEVGFLIGTEPNCTVNEFNDPTPTIDMGDDAARWFLDSFPELKTKGEVRLAQKPNEWLLGHGTSPRERKVAPLHIVTLQSVEAAQVSQNNPLAGYDRYRPNIVINAPDHPAGSEVLWKYMILPEVDLKVNCETVRCEVTKQNQLTGENLNDLSIQGFPNKNKFGIYVEPLLLPGELARVALQDKLIIEM
jgi:uncharacterized protein YcbX